MLRCGPIALLATLVACSARPTPLSEPPAAGPTSSDAADVGVPVDPLADVTLQPRPDWMDKYADQNEGDMRFFDIDALMQAHGLTRAQAVELQNHYRDLSRSEPGDARAWFDRALARVQRGEFEDQRDREALEDAPFIVVFDLDETMYDQYYDAEVAARCHDVSFQEPGGDAKHFKIAPGWREAIAKIRELGGVVVLFSANRDETNWANLTHWTLDGQPLSAHPDIAAVLTNSHLVLQSKRRGDPVVEPSKDLRIFDEGLQRVIIVDDNPVRLFQLRNARVTHKFDAEQWCSAEADGVARRAFEQTLPTVVTEIEESVGYARRHEVSFATAYLPYSVLGRVAVDWAVSTGMHRADAVRWVREHPGDVPEAF